MIVSVEYETCDWLSARHAWGCLGLLGRLICERDCAGSTWVVVVIRPLLSCALRFPSLWLVLLIDKVTETRMLAGSEYVENKPSVGYLTQLLLF